jgi:parvulin-like peptidyl-prolyl isomerase
LALAACNPGPTGSPNTAATVNGDEVTVADVERRFDAVRENPQLAQQLEADEDGAFQQQVEAQILTQLIQSHLLRQGAEELGVEVTDADVAAKREEIIEEVGGQDAFDDIVEQNNLTDDDVNDQLRDLTLQERIEEELAGGVEVTEAEVSEFYEQNREMRYGESASARHILTESEEEAQDALTRIEEGEDFGDVAEEVSTDEGSAVQGGDLGEFTRDRMVPEFAEAVFNAEVGEVVGPVESEFGFHVIEVTDRQDGPALEDVSDEIRDELAEQRRGEAVQSWLAEQQQQAEVEVNPRFGEWDAATGQVVTADPLGEPPAGEAPGDPGAGDPGAPEPLPEDEQTS